MMPEMNSCVSEGLLCYCSQLFSVSSFGLLSYLVYYYLGKVLWEKMIICIALLNVVLGHNTFSSIIYTVNPIPVAHADYFTSNGPPSGTKLHQKQNQSSVVAWPLTCGWHLDTTHIHTEAHWLLLWQVLCQVLHVFFLAVYHEIAGTPRGPWVCRNVD